MKVLFSPYHPKGSHYPVKYYSVTDNDVCIGYKTKALMQVTAPDAEVVQEINDALLAAGINLNNIDKANLFPLLEKAGFIHKVQPFDPKPFSNRRRMSLT